MGLIVTLSTDEKNLISKALEYYINNMTEEELEANDDLCSSLYDKGF